MIRLLAGGIAAALAVAAATASAGPPDLCLRLEDDRPPVVCLPVGGGGSG